MWMENEELEAMIVWDEQLWGGFFVVVLFGLAKFTYIYI